MACDALDHDKFESDHFDLAKTLSRMLYQLQKKMDNNSEVIDRIRVSGE